MTSPRPSIRINPLSITLKWKEDCCVFRAMLSIVTTHALSWPFRLAWSISSSHFGEGSCILSLSLQYQLLVKRTTHRHLRLHPLVNFQDAFYVIEKYCSKGVTIFILFFQFCWETSEEFLSLVEHDSTAKGRKCVSANGDAQWSGMLGKWVFLMMRTPPHRGWGT